MDIKKNKIEMPQFTFSITEKATYVQEGTVTVTAASDTEARLKVMNRQYEHHGDNKIDYNTEQNTHVLSMEIINP